MKVLEEPHTDESRPQGDQGLVDVPIRVGSQSELAEAMEPGVRSLHHPAVDSQAAAVFGTALGDLGVDGPVPQLLPVRLRVIGPVAGQFIRPRGPVPSSPARSGMSSTRGSICVTAASLAPATVVARGMPLASVSTWCFVPNLPRSVGLGPVSSPPPSARAFVLSTAPRDQPIRPAS